MKKRKVAKSHRKSHKSQTRLSYGLSSGRKVVYGLEQDFILIVGGSFVLVVFGVMLLFR